MNYNPRRSRARWRAGNQQRPAGYPEGSGTALVNAVRDRAGGGAPVATGNAHPQIGNVYTGGPAHPGSAAPVANVQTPGGPPVSDAPTLSGDPGLIAAQNQGGLVRGLADMTAAFQTGQLASDYGFGANGQVDPNNPYSRAGLLLDHFRRSGRGNTNSFAGAGQLHSGAYQRAQGEAVRNYAVGGDRLLKDYQRQVGQVGLDRVGSYVDSYGGETEALLAALMRTLK